MKVFCAAFLGLQFGFVIFWRKEFIAKAVRKLLLKLTTGKENDWGGAGGTQRALIGLLLLNSLFFSKHTVCTRDLGSSLKVKVTSCVFLGSPCVLLLHVAYFTVTFDHCCNK